VTVTVGARPAGVISERRNSTSGWTEHAARRQLSGSVAMINDREPA